MEQACFTRSINSSVHLTTQAKNKQADLLKFKNDERKKVERFKNDGKRKNIFY
jgi:hypothetical protein